MQLNQELVNKLVSLLKTSEEQNIAFDVEVTIKMVDPAERAPIVQAQSAESSQESSVDVSKNDQQQDQVVVSSSAETHVSAPVENTSADIDQQTDDLDSVPGVEDQEPVKVETTTVAVPSNSTEAPVSTAKADHTRPRPTSRSPQVGNEQRHIAMCIRRQHQCAQANIDVPEELLIEPETVDQAREINNKLRPFLAQLSH